MPEKPYEVKVIDIFEGPMDLLVHLIKKNELDIYDIPISLITQQYLEYLDWLKMMNIDFAGDFLVMASTLANIKSKMLLPETEEDEEEDPRMEITEPLLEYLQMKSAAENLSERPVLGKDVFIRKIGKPDQYIDQEDEMIKIGLFELIDAFQEILKKMSPDHKVDLTVDKISVKERISELIDIFEQQKSITFTDLFKGNFTKSDVIITFLAILEMVKLNLLGIAQQVQTGVIRLIYQ